MPAGCLKRQERNYWNSMAFVTQLEQLLYIEETVRLIPSVRRTSKTGGLVGPMEE